MVKAIENLCDGVFRCFRRFRRCLRFFWSFCGVKSIWCKGFRRKILLVRELLQSFSRFDLIDLQKKCNLECKQITLHVARATQIFNTQPYVIAKCKMTFGLSGYLASILTECSFIHNLPLQPGFSSR